MAWKRERREKILQILRQLGTDKINKSDLARQVNVDRATIDKDLKAISSEIEHIPKETLARKFDILGEKALAEALDILRTTKNDNARIGAIRTLLDIADKEIAWRYKLGLLDIRPEEQKIIAEQRITILQAIKILEESEDGSRRIRIEKVRKDEQEL